MTSHRTIVSWGFKATAVLIGAPAAIACIGLTLDAMAFHRLASPDHPHMLSVQKYGLVGLLTDGAVGVDRVLGVFSGLAAWALGVLAVLAFLAALWAILLFLIGRGLTRGAAWARIAGAVIAALLLLSSLGGLAVAPYRLVLAPSLPIATALYTLWTLIWRFRSPADVRR